jgi:hypothetical protein
MADAVGAARRPTRASVVDLNQWGGLPEVAAQLPRPRHAISAMVRLPRQTSHRGDDASERGWPPPATRSPARSAHSRRERGGTPGTPGVAPLTVFRGMTPALTHLSEQWRDRTGFLLGPHVAAQVSSKNVGGLLDAEWHADGWNEDGYATRVLRCPQDKSTQPCGITAVQICESRIVTMAPDALRIWELFLDDSSSSGLLFEVPPVCRPLLILSSPKPLPPWCAHGTSSCPPLPPLKSFLSNLAAASRRRPPAYRRKPSGRTN